MNEDRRKRGFVHSNFLTAVAISALFLSSGNAMAAQTNTDSSLEVTEQLQVQTVSGLVVDASGDPVIGASVVEIGTTNGIITDMDGKFKDFICWIPDTRDKGFQNNESRSERR